MKIKMSVDCPYLILRSVALSVSSLSELIQVLFDSLAKGEFIPVVDYHSI
jgi:hypothetical protein